jgi:hypothetical protein
MTISPPYNASQIARRRQRLRTGIEARLTHPQLLVEVMVTAAR